MPIGIIIDEVVSGPKCAHCEKPQRGRASYNMEPLCHPNEGMDCYTLVSREHHEMPCYPCQTGVGIPGHSHPITDPMSGVLEP